MLDATEILKFRASCNPSADTYLQLAKHYLKQHEWGQAVKAAERAMDSDPAGIQGSGVAREACIILFDTYRRTGYKMGVRQIYEKLRKLPSAELPASIHRTCRAEGLVLD